MQYPPASFPATRLRRNRAEPWLRRLVAETQLSVNDLIWPVFVQDGSKKSTPIPSMPGVFRYSVDRLVAEVKIARDLGIPAIALFPATPANKKSDDAREAWNPDNLICRATAAVKAAVPDIGIICDVALDPYTTHGHDGLLAPLPLGEGGAKRRVRASSNRTHTLTQPSPRGRGLIDNDTTLAALTKQAVNQARAGCDIVAPSDMMDGRIGAIRAALDAAGFSQVAILSYAAKYASAFYGPFRDAVGSKTKSGGIDKRSYQMNPANALESLREVALDIAEGADMVMVKPGLPYLDVISAVSREFPVPVFAYQVSGEYAMLCAAAEKGWLNYEATVFESLLSLKRAGASGILTYAAREVALQLEKSPD